MEIKNKGKENEYKIVTSFNDIEENGLDKKYYLVLSPIYSDNGNIALTPYILEAVCPYKIDNTSIEFITKGIKNESEYTIHGIKVKVLGKRFKFNDPQLTHDSNCNILDICTSLEDAIKCCDDIYEFNNEGRKSKIDNYNNRVEIVIEDQKRWNDRLKSNECDQKEFDIYIEETNKSLNKYNYILSNLKNKPKEFKLHKIFSTYKFVSHMITENLEGCNLCVNQKPHIHGSATTYTLKDLENCKLSVTPLADNECIIEFTYGNSDIYKFFHFLFTYEDYKKLMSFLKFMEVRYKLM